VAVDTVEGLCRTVGARSELGLRLHNGGSEAAEGGRPDLDTIDGVESTTRSDGVLRVAVSDPRAKARVVTELTTAGVEVLDVDSDEASLEDVFRAYTAGGSDTGDGQQPAAVAEVAR
jgi:ABC-2 type transport system ATP-binding protein